MNSETKDLSLQLQKRDMMLNPQKYAEICFSRNGFTTSELYEYSLATQQVHCADAQQPERRWLHIENDDGTLTDKVITVKEYGDVLAEIYYDEEYREGGTKYE